MARRSLDSTKKIVVSVVGVSGGEREKGVTGVGKSCICNRFIRPGADDYHVDHISVLSQTDFSGRVVNNDHFLYWGDLIKVSEDGAEYNFHIIEQTEFIDDASFMPFKAGKMESYIKRCSNTKMQSAEKLMYICKNQLGIEKEYEQKVLPDGKLNVDGFLCIFDVSQVPNRSLDKMVDLTAAILLNCVKTKRPVVLVTTKNDEANDLYVKEAEKLCCRKDLKGNVPLIESSSHENVNVEAAFLTLAQLIDKNRGKVRIVPFFEAARQRKEVLDMAADIYVRLLRNIISDYQMPWAIASKSLAPHSDFGYFVDLMGIDAAVRLFKRHTKKLKEEFLQQKLDGYMQILTHVLHNFFPDFQTLRDGDWLDIQDQIGDHPEFDRYFLRADDDIPWSENIDLLNSGDNRIPFDALDSNQAETVFKNHLNALQMEQEMRELRERFRNLLNETGYVTPGKRLDEVRVLFMGRESFDSLSEGDRQSIYEHHQKDITEKARQKFLELLLEHAEMFDHIKSMVPSGTITPDDIREITQTLQEDSRYKNLDRLENERTLLLLQHLGFIHCPKREHCPAFTGCVDALTELFFAQFKAASNSRPTSGTWSSKGGKEKNSILDQRNHGPENVLDFSNQIKLVLLGSHNLGQELKRVIKTSCENDEFELSEQIYMLEYRIIENVNNAQVIILSFKADGMVCAYNDDETFTFLREVLDKELRMQHEKNENAFSTPAALLFMPDSSLTQDTIDRLVEEGENLAERLGCSFEEMSPQNFEEKSEQSMKKDVIKPEPIRMDVGVVTKALGGVIRTVVERRQMNDKQKIISLNHNVSIIQTQPDIRIIMCMLCGDPFSIDSLLSPLAVHNPIYQPRTRSIAIHAFLDDCKRRVELIISSYHGAPEFKDELVHGFILVFSTKRKASLASLKAFSNNIPNLPIQIVAVTELVPASAFFSCDITQQLLTEANKVADRLQARFVTTAANSQLKAALYAPFFKEVWDKKNEIEEALRMEDPLEALSGISGPSGLDDSGEGTLERPRHPNRGFSLWNPLHRQHMPRRSRSVEGSGSEIYEAVGPLSPHSTHSDAALSPSPHSEGTPSDDSDLYSHNNEEKQRLVKPSHYKKNKGHFNQGNRSSFKVYPPPTTPPEPAPPDRGLIQGSKGPIRDPSRKLVKATTLPTSSTVNTTVPSRTSLEDINSDAGSRDSLVTRDSGWADESLRTRNRDDIWSEKNYAPHIFSTGRRAKFPPPPIRPKPKTSQTLKQPGKLDLRDYSNVTDAINKISIRDGSQGHVAHGRPVSQENAPLAMPESLDLASEYTPVKESVPPHYLDNELFSYSSELAQAATAKARQRHHFRHRDKGSRLAYSDSDSDMSSPDRRRHGSDTSRSNRKIVTKRTKKKRTPIPVATPRVPPIPGFFESGSARLSDEKLLIEESEKEKDRFGVAIDEESSLAYSPLGDLPQSPLLGSDVVPAKSSRKEAKIRSKEKEAKIKEKKLEEKLKKEKEKEKKKSQKKGRPSTPTLADFSASSERPVPEFFQKCVMFIESHGLDSEGIYRVPGNKVHVETLVSKFKEDSNVSFIELDIPVNAAATALKDYIKTIPPLLPNDKMMELTNIAGIGDRSCRLLKLKELLMSLPNVNFEVIKYIFQHFVRVSENSKLNSMDSKNISICWWPTLLHSLQFTDISAFEAQRPHIEDIVQTMIDQFPFLFQGKEDYVMV